MIESQHQKNVMVSADQPGMSDSTTGCWRLNGSDIDKALVNPSECTYLGGGQSGSVYRIKIGGILVAIKRLKPGRRQIALEREVRFLNDLRHPHILLLMGYCPERMCIVYEYMSGGSLKDRLEAINKDNTKASLPWADRIRIASELCSGLLFMHQRNMVHRDLKPANVLLDRNNVSKIADVGLAQLCDFAIMESIVRGTPGYIDPDHLRNGYSTKQSDVYALGLVILQLFTGICDVSDLHQHLEKCGELNEEIGGLEEAVNTLSNKLDPNAGRWAVGLARPVLVMALKCTERDPQLRPDLEKEMQPELSLCAEEAQFEMQRRREDLIKHFFCPLSEMPLEDPVVAADGYTYERIYISQVLANSNISPVTKSKLAHKNLVPNIALKKLKEMQDYALGFQLL